MPYADLEHRCSCGALAVHRRARVLSTTIKLELLTIPCAQSIALSKLTGIVELDVPELSQALDGVDDRFLERAKRHAQLLLDLAVVEVGRATQVGLNKSRLPL